MSTTKTKTATTVNANKNLQVINFGKFANKVQNFSEKNTA